jgi:heme ABC exporter ATP-binding subunit CcmA/heme exporter protein CcmB
VIEVRDLRKSFGYLTALAGVSLCVERGETVLLVGPNGAGKTTLMRVLAGLSRPTSGVVRVGGGNPFEDGAGVRRRIGFLSHQPLLYDDLSAEGNLAFYARLYRLPEAQRRIDELLDRVGLARRRHDLVRSFSRGMQQRLALARAVLHRPELLLLDEPYTGLDLLAAEGLTELLLELSGEGRTLLLSTHDLTGPRVGARAVVLSGGRVVHDAPLVDVAAFPALYRELVSGGGRGMAPSTGEGRRAPSRVDEGAGPEGRLPGFWAQAWSVTRKDLAAEVRTREVVNAMLVFALLALLIFSFALDLRGELAEAAAPGVLWTTVAFAGTLGLSRSLAREERARAIDGLLAAPLERTAIFFGKALGILVLMLVVEALLLPLGAVLLDAPFLAPGVLPVVLLGTAGYAAVGTLLAAIAVNTRAREVMLPVLLLPLAVPLLIAAVRATGAAMAGGEGGPWVRLLVVYDLLITAVAMLTFDHVVEG